MAELVDAADSKSAVRKDVQVRFLFRALFVFYNQLISIEISISTKTSRDKSKVWYYLEWGRLKGQRRATSIFTFTKPKDLIQKNHNKEALAISEKTRSQMTLDSQSINSVYVPQHKLKTNFLDFYSEFVRLNPTKGNRHLASSRNAFEKFISKDFITPVEVTESLCERFRNYLLTNFNGERQQIIS